MEPIDYTEDTSHLFIKFYESTKKNEQKSALEGRPVHDVVDMVEIRMAGDSKTVIHAPANDKSKFVQGYGHLTYIQRFPRHWDYYQKTKSNLSEGTPLEEIPAIDAARRADLRALNIHSVDALASLSDTHVKKLGMDGSKLRDLAREYLAKAENMASSSALVEQNAQLSDKLTALEAELARLKAEGERKTLSIPAKDKAA